MASAVVNICVDPRLDHNVIRLQVASRLERLGLRAERIFVTNDVGGNIGANLQNTVEMIRQRADALVFAAVLHHDDCLAAQAGLRRPLATSAATIQVILNRAGVTCPLLTGSIVTATNEVLWTDEPPQGSEVLAFRMPRMFGAESDKARTLPTLNTTPVAVATEPSQAHFDARSQAAGSRQWPESPTARPRQGANGSSEVQSGRFSVLFWGAAVSALLVLVLALVVAVIVEPEKSPETQGSTPVLTPISPTAVPGLVTRLANGRIAIGDAEGDCLIDGAPTRCEASALDLADAEVWMQGSTLFIALDVHQSDFNQIEAYNIRFGFDVDGNPSNGLPALYEANGLKADLEIRLERLDGQAPRARASVNAGLGLPAPRWEINGSHLQMELSPFPAQAFEMVVVLESGGASDATPEGGKFHFPTGTFIPR